MVFKAAQVAANKTAALKASFTGLLPHTESKITTDLESDSQLEEDDNPEDLLSYAEDKIAEMKSESQYFEDEDLSVMPKFELNELSLGRLLGKGGFGTVSEIKSITCARIGTKGSVSNEEDGDVEQKHQDKQFIADHCVREGGDARYAIKALSPEVKSDDDLYIQGVIDMAVETMFLAVIDHPHIIKMRGFGSCGMTHPNYFIILDRLYDTLGTRITKWKRQTKKANGVMNKLKKKSSEENSKIMEMKLKYAYDLMGAIQYLHQKGLIHRDCKPANIGFNVRNDIVLFDFGLAREMHDKDKVSEDTWLLTGTVGSPRYMAPECAMNKPYGYSADIYSMGLIIWEMLTMDKPYEGFNLKALHDRVYASGYRPHLEECWSKSLSSFISACWDHDPSKRPSASRASNILKREATKISRGGATDLNNFRRKSTFVNRDSLKERRSMNRAAAYNATLLSDLLAVSEDSE